MKSIIAVTNGNVISIAVVTSPNVQFRDTMTLPSGRNVVKDKIKYRSNGDIIYFYKEIDSDGQSK